MRNSFCRQQVNKIERKTNHVQIKPMFLQFLPGRGLPMRMPEPQSRLIEGWLSVRGCLQVRPFLQLQALVVGRHRAAYCAIEPGPTAASGQYAVSL
jgi:hypothetical protein